MGTACISLTSDLQASESRLTASSCCIAGIYALLGRAKLRAAELSVDAALTLLYTLDSFEFCVGGDGALDYTLRHTYLMNSKEETLRRCAGPA
jgi:hypothetical protein